MGNFYTIEIAETFPLVPHGTSGGDYQTKDLPSDEDSSWDDFGYGQIRADGLFLRDDQTWNPTLHGWACLIADLTVRSPTGTRRVAFEIWVRFEAGRAVQVSTEEAIGRLCVESLPGQWRRYET